MYSLSEALKFVLKWEGGFVNHPSDPGGATNKGITQGTYDSYRRKKKLPIQTVANITSAEVTEIYEEMYWEASRAKWLQPPLALAVFDTAVNFGVGGAIRRLQQALGLKPTGKWTPQTSERVHAADALAVAREIVRLRIAHRHYRVQQKPSQRVFLKGWLNRDRDLLKAVDRLAGIGVLTLVSDGPTDIQTVDDSYLLDMLAHDVEPDTLHELSQDDAPSADRAPNTPILTAEDDTDVIQGV
jgi:lysozyme family protein